MGSFKHPRAFDPQTWKSSIGFTKLLGRSLRLASRSVTGSVILSGKRRYASRSLLALQDT